MPSGWGSPTGRTPHERSRVPPQRSGVTAISSPATAMKPLPAAALREALRVEDDRAPVAEVLARLLECGVAARPGDVHRDIGVVRLDDDTKRVERFDDLDAQGTDGDVHPVVERLGCAHDALHAVAGDGEEGIGRPEVEVLAEPEDREVVVGRRVEVEVVAVVEIAIAGGGVADVFRRLMDGVVVPARDARVVRGRGVHGRDGIR